MTQDLTAVAEAFSSHRFADVYPRLAPDVHWVIVGAGTVTGREAVVDACEQSLPELESSTREWLRFTTIAGARAVAVDTVARYVDAAHETSVVASCDIYEFDSDQLARTPRTSSSSLTARRHVASTRRPLPSEHVLDEAAAALAGDALQRRA